MLRKGETAPINPHWRQIMCFSILSSSTTRLSAAALLVAAGLSLTPVTAAADSLVTQDIIVAENKPVPGGVTINVVRVDPVTAVGTTLATFTPDPIGPVAWDIVIADPDTVFVIAYDAATHADSSIYEVDLVTGFSAEVTTVPPAPLSIHPRLAVDENGDLLTNTSIGGTATLLRVNRDTFAQTVVSNDPLLHDLGSIAVASNGDIFALNNAASALPADLVRIDPDTGAASVAVTPVDGLTFIVADLPNATIAGTHLTWLYELDPVTGGRQLLDYGINLFRNVALERTGVSSTHLLAPVGGVLHRKDITSPGMPLNAFYYSNEGASVEAVAVLHPACSDGIDNDGDGAADFPHDAGCANVLDPSEAQNPPPPSCAASPMSMSTTTSAWPLLLIGLAWWRRRA